MNQRPGCVCLVFGEQNGQLRLGIKANLATKSWDLTVCVYIYPLFYRHLPVSVTHCGVTSTKYSHTVTPRLMEYWHCGKCGASRKWVSTQIWSNTGCFFPTWPLSNSPTVQWVLITLSKSYHQRDRSSNSRHRLSNIPDTRRKAQRW